MRPRCSRAMRSRRTLGAEVPVSSTSSSTVHSPWPRSRFMIPSARRSVLVDIEEIRGGLRLPNECTQRLALCQSKFDDLVVAFQFWAIILRLNDHFSAPSLDACPPFRCLPTFLPLGFSGCPDGWDTRLGEARSALLPGNWAGFYPV